MTVVIEQMFFFKMNNWCVKEMSTIQKHPHTDLLMGSTTAKAILAVTLQPLSQIYLSYYEG